MGDVVSQSHSVPGASAEAVDAPVLQSETNADRRRRTAKAAAAATRASLVNAAYHDMRRSGYQGVGVGDILSRTGLTKGAFYHHFDSKRTLGLAVIDDCVAADLDTWWMEPIAETVDPLSVLQSTVTDRLGAALTGDDDGSSLFATLTADMAPLDEGFRTRLEGLYRAWRKAVAKALRRGQQSGTVRTDVDAESAAALIVATVEGMFLQLKAAPRTGGADAALAGLTQYLGTLRAS